MAEVGNAVEQKQFSDVWFFAPENAGKYGEEVAWCRTLTFMDAYTFEMLTPCGPKGAIFSPSPMKGTLVMYADDRRQGILHGVRESSNKRTKPNHWLGAFDRVEWA